MDLTAEQIEQALRSAGLLRLPAGVGSHLLTYLTLLTRWNARINLTSIRTPEEIVQRHFIESAIAAEHLPWGIDTLLDFGSGGGFPGIPIALCRPEIHVTLAESQSKKASFLREVVRSLGLRTEVYGGRVENLPSDQRFDAVILRAVDRMPEALKTAAPRARRVLAMMVAASDAQRHREHLRELKWREELGLGDLSGAVLLIGERSMEGMFHVER